eukprot:CAMPEP_0182526568 /NCGR_PEP_ID=MMETSP1323-20130603/3283_1 /TAXON_ID=236787 /ORGANISM="Florenciella parvula, Strain RCC1693" /LENGTH=187 /DNA_ID=CAMNT_0024735449 /DNA_START=60 /DNA_END=620 /DNA_ORIENTATION=-
MSAHTTAERAALHESLGNLNRADLAAAQTAVGDLLGSVSVTVAKEAEGRHPGENHAAREARARMVETAQMGLLRDIVALAPASLPGPLGRMVGKTDTLTGLKTGATAYLAAAWRINTDFPGKEWGLGQDWLLMPTANASQEDRVAILESYEVAIPFFPRLPDAPEAVPGAGVGDARGDGLGAGGGGA